MNKLLTIQNSLSIRTQIGVLLIVAQLLAHAAGIFVFRYWFYTSEDSIPVGLAIDILEPASTVVGLLREADTDLTDQILAAAVKTDRRFVLENGDKLATAETVGISKQMQLAVFAKAFPDISLNKIRLLPVDNDKATARVAVNVRQDQWLVFQPTGQTLNSNFRFFILIFGIFLLAVPLAGFAVWASGALISPLQELAATAEHFSSDLNSPPAALKGPKEVRTVARTFNAMRERIKKSIDSRTFALAAISHDLRTPLTRMRLRAESLGNSSAHLKLISQVDEMEKLIESSMNYLRGEISEKRSQVCNLPDLVKSTLQEFSKQGFKTMYKGADFHQIDCDPEMLLRAFRNLVENSVRYASEIEVVLDDNSNEAKTTIRFLDNGPGINAPDINEAFEPFKTHGQSRDSRSKTGFGLGLSIVRDIVKKHRGSVSLNNRPSGGLCVTITLSKSSKKADN